MKKLKVISGFTGYNQIELLQKAELILASMVGNKNFPNPFPSLKTLERSINNFSKAIYEEQEYTAVKSITRSILTDDLNQLVKYVNTVAEGNEAALRTSGFTLENLMQRIA